VAGRDTPVAVSDPGAVAAGLVDRLRGLGSEKDRAGMARYGINVDDAFGVSVYELRRIAREYPSDHGLASALWDTGVHEARLLAAFVDDPEEVTREQAERWALDFDSWDLTDQVTTSLLDRSPLARDLALEWARRPEEFVKRGGFALMAGRAAHDKDAEDADFGPFLAAVQEQAGDERNFVKKAVNWALRNMGKRNATLNAEAVRCARAILAEAGDARDAAARARRWVAKDALRELEGEKVRTRLGLTPLGR
jgi:3-methyladenine DNA glycosylase AlkD